MNDKLLSIIITAKDEASAVMAKVAATVDATSASMTKMGDAMVGAGRSMESTGSSMTRAFTLPIAAVGFAATKMAMDFQQSMTYVRTDAGDTTDNIDQLSSAVLNLAKTSQFSPDELANGLYHLASLGLRGADAMNALNTAQKMAAVGGADLESTSSALGAALVTGIKGVQDYSSAAGTLDAIIGAGNMRMQDLVESLGTGVLTAFKNAGLSLQEYGAALATLTDNGMGAAESATRLRMTIAMMTAPTGPAIDALKRLGMTQDQLGMDMQQKGLIPALSDLKQHLLDTYGTTDEGKVKMQQALSDMFGGGRSSSAIITLLDQLDRVGTKEKQIGDQSGEFATKVAEQQQTASAKMKTAWDSIQVNLIQLGADILPTVAGFVTSLSKVVDRLSEAWDRLSPSTQKIIEDIALFLAVGGPMLVLVGKIVSGIGSLIKIGAGAVGLVKKIFDVGSAVADLAIVSAKAVAAAAVWTAKAIETAAVWTAQFAVMAAKAVANAVVQSAQAIVSGTIWIAQAVASGAAWTASFALMIAKATPSALLMALKAADVGTAWVINAVTASFVWVTTELPKIVAGMATTAVSASVSAVKTSAAWILSATTTSFVWVTTELPKIVLGFITTSAAATAHATVTSAAWIASAATSAIAWVFTELPRIVAGFVVTSAAAIAEAAITSGAWVASSSTTAIAWAVTTLPRIIAAFAVMSASAVASAATATAAWVASTVTTTATYEAMAGLIATPLVMPAIVVAAAIAALGSVIAKVWETKQVVEDMNAAVASNKASVADSVNTLEAEAIIGNDTTRARAKSSLHQMGVAGYATGGFTGRGNATDVAGFVHKGEYVLPQSAVDQNTGQPKMSGSTFNMYGSINLGSADAVDRFFTRLNSQKELGALGVGV